MIAYDTFIGIEGLYRVIDMRLRTAYIRRKVLPAEDID